MSNTIKNFSHHCLAPIGIRAAYKQHDWVAIPVPPNKVLDLSSYRNLYIRCHTCGEELREAEGGTEIICPVCGENDFDVMQLAELSEIDVPDFSMRVSNAGFLRMELPADLKKQYNIHYTLDGSTPSNHSPRFTQAFSLPGDTVQVKACLFGTNSKSRIYTLNIPHTGTCPSCKTKIKSAEKVVVCSSCKLDLLWDSAQRIWIQDPTKKPTKQCEDCGAKIELSGDEVACPCCNAVYHREGSTWVPGKKACIFNCKICGTQVTASTQSATCPNCGTQHNFDAIAGKWIIHAEKKPKASPPKSDVERKKPSKQCEDCGAIIELSGDEVVCPCCNAEYHREGSTWVPGKKARILNCKICGTQMTATTQSATCPKCHASHQLSGDIWLCQGIPHQCDLCGSSLRISASSNTCPKCNAKYDISKSGNIAFKGAEIKCLNCSESLTIKKLSATTCPNCGTQHNFDAVAGKWIIHAEEKPEATHPESDVERSTYAILMTYYAKRMVGYFVSVSVFALASYLSYEDREVTFLVNGIIPIPGWIIFAVFASGTIALIGGFINAAWMLIRSSINWFRCKKRT